MKQHKQDWLNRVFSKKKCKFSSECLLFSDSSRARTVGGGTYCGQFRELNAKRQTIVAVAYDGENDEDGISLMVNPDVNKAIIVEP